MIKDNSKEITAKESEALKRLSEKYEQQERIKICEIAEGLLMSGTLTNHTTAIIDAAKIYDSLSDFAS